MIGRSDGLQTSVLQRGEAKLDGSAAYFVIFLVAGAIIGVWRAFEKNHQPQDAAAATLSAERSAMKWSATEGRQTVVRQYRTASEYRMDAERMTSMGWRIEAQASDVTTDIVGTIRNNWLTDYMSGTKI